MKHNDYSNYDEVTNSYGAYLDEDDVMAQSKVRKSDKIQLILVTLFFTGTAAFLFYLDIRPIYLLLNLGVLVFFQGVISFGIRFSYLYLRKRLELTRPSSILLYIMNDPVKEQYIMDSFVVIASIFVSLIDVWIIYSGS